MKRVLLILLCGSLFFGTQAFAQTYTATVETDQVQSSTGSLINFGGTIGGQTLNLFHGVVDASTDLDALFDPVVASGNLSGIISAFETITWSPMIDGTAFPGLEWYSDFGQSIAVGEKPVVAFMNAASPGDLIIGSEIGLVESVDIGSTLDNITTGFTTGQPYTVIVGTPGSIQLTAIVPEPAHYAALLGALGLMFVMWRRRR